MFENCDGPGFSTATFPQANHFSAGAFLSPGTSFARRAFPFSCLVVNKDFPQFPSSYYLSKGSLLAKNDRLRPSFQFPPSPGCNFHAETYRPLLTAFLVFSGSNRIPLFARIALILCG